MAYVRFALKCKPTAFLVCGYQSSYLKSCFFFEAELCGISVLLDCFDLCREISRIVFFRW